MKKSVIARSGSPIRSRIGLGWIAFNLYESPSVEAAQELGPRSTLPDKDALWMPAANWLYLVLHCNRIGAAIIVIVMSFVMKWTPPRPSFGHHPGDVCGIRHGGSLPAAAQPGRDDRHVGDLDRLCFAVAGIGSHRDIARSHRR